MTSRVHFLVALAFFGALYLALARFAFEAFPYSGDEHSYALQGEIFARGELSVPAPAHRELMLVDHVVIDDRVRTKYPPGWPALIAPFARVGAPWAANPAVGIAILALLWAATRRLFGDEAALASTLLLAVAPFFALHVASFHSHPSSLLGGALLFYGLVRASPSRSLGWSALAGVGVALSFLVRPVDGIVYGVGILAFWRVPRIVVPAVAASALGPAIMLAYDKLQFGSALTTGYAAYAPLLTELYGDHNAATTLQLYNLVRPIVHWRHVEWVVDLSAMLAPATLVLGVVGARERVAGDANVPVRRALLLVTAAQTLVMVLSMEDYGEGYGPRYMFPYLLPLAAFAGAGFLRVRALLEGRVPARVTAYALAAIVAAGGIRLALKTEHVREDFDRRTSLSKTVAAMHLTNAVVIVKTEFPTRYTRNGITFDGPVLYVAPRGASDDAVARAFPGRAVYVAEAVDREARWNVGPVAALR